MSPSHVVPVGYVVGYFLQAAAPLLVIEVESRKLVHTYTQTGIQRKREGGRGMRERRIDGEREGGNEKMEEGKE